MRTKKRKVTKASLKRELKRVTEERNTYDNDQRLFKDALVKVYKLCLAGEHNKVLDTTVKTFARADPFVIY
jgi:hypothetical protein